MANFTIGIGIALIALGVFSFFSTGAVSYTALIPSGFGLILLALGVFAQDPAKRKNAMHIALFIGSVGIGGSVSGLIKSFQLMAGQEVARPGAVVAQAIMCVLCIVLVSGCIKSFIDARRARAAGLQS